VNLGFTPTLNILSVGVYIPLREMTVVMVFNDTRRRSDPSRSGRALLKFFGRKRELAFLSCRLAPGVPDAVRRSLFYRVIFSREFILRNKYFFERHNGIKFIKYQNCFTIIVLINATIRKRGAIVR